MDRVAGAVRAKYLRKILAYNCSPSFNWKRNWTLIRLPGSNVN